WRPRSSKPKVNAWPCSSSTSKRPPLSRSVVRTEPSSLTATSDPLVRPRAARSSLPRSVGSFALHAAVASKIPTKGCFMPVYYGRSRRGSERSEDDGDAHLCVQRAAAVMAGRAREREPKCSIQELCLGVCEIRAQAIRDHHRRAIVADRVRLPD